jgi:hypothetical protein
MLAENHFQYFGIFGIITPTLTEKEKISFSILRAKNEGQAIVIKYFFS